MYKQVIINAVINVTSSTVEANVMDIYVVAGSNSIE
jgi:hypothetical protein